SAANRDCRRRVVRTPFPLTSGEALLFPRLARFQKGLLLLRAERVGDGSPRSKGRQSATKRVTITLKFGQGCDMKVSVISATWNRGTLLRRALETYLRQTLPLDQWEYLLADDASTDDTQEVVEELRARGLPIRAYDSAQDLNKPKEPGVWRDGCVLRNAV